MNLGMVVIGGNCCHHEQLFLVSEQQFGYRHRQNPTTSTLHHLGWY